ncbi:FecR family protein [Pseudomonas sp. Z6-20]|uniref:FecR family protein n=1 Tax=unclassified Pseudomonas TaxID=196821 RepID=UPI003DA9FC9C
MSISASESATATANQLREEAFHWLVRLTSGHATHADAEAFRRWSAQSSEHARAFFLARQLWQAMAPAEQKLQQEQAAKVVNHPRRFGRRAFLGGAIAASVAVLVARPSLLDGWPVGADFHTGVGEQRRVDLTQGVVLELNTQTRISQRSEAPGDAAIEVLSGELEIQASTALRVLAGNGELFADGARFNVRATEGSVCVTCLEGRLQLKHQGRRVSLEQGRQLTYTAQRQGQPTPFDTQQVMAWRQQLLVFNDAPLASVIDEINRYRPGMIVLMNAELGRRKVQARFSLAQLANVAVLIRDAYGATITELPGGVVLVS